MTPEEKLSRKRARMIEKSREYTTGTYKAKFVSPVFQSMIRAEYGAEPEGTFPAIWVGELLDIPRKVGQVVCVTCGLVGPWSGGIGGHHTGHFLASRRNSILYVEDNVAPQCSRCNVYRAGAANEFRKWMIAVRGAEVVERLEQLKTDVVQFTREQLVDMRLEFAARLKKAEEVMRG